MSNEYTELTDLKDDENENDIDLTLMKKWDIFICGSINLEKRVSIVHSYNKDEMCEFLYKCFFSVIQTSSSILKENLIYLVIDTQLSYDFKYQIADYILTYFELFTASVALQAIRTLLNEKWQGDNLNNSQYLLLIKLLEVEFQEIKLNTNESLTCIISYVKNNLEKSVSNYIKLDRVKHIDHKKIAGVSSKLLAITLSQKLFNSSILLLTYFINKQEKDENYKELIVSFIERLKWLSNDPNIIENQIADLNDLILKHGTESQKSDALEVINRLGGSSNGNIYENKQNVHSVQANIDQVIDRLITPIISIENIVNSLTTPLTTDTTSDITTALNRILDDRQTYGSKSLYSYQILEYIWNHIQNSDHKKVLHERLLEELTDMADTCSSGHALRLVNVLSGYDGFEIKIRFTDQIIANLMGRLYAKIRLVDDEEKKGEIFSEMINRSLKKPELRSIIKFELPNIIKDLHSEFVPNFVSEEEFDVAIRDGMVKFDVA